MRPANWANLGWLTLQDWDTKRELVAKHTMAAMRHETPDDPEDVYSKNLTEGHLLGGLYWEEVDRDGVDTWWITSPPVQYFQAGVGGSDEGEPDDAGGFQGRPTTGDEGRPTTGTAGGVPTTGGTGDLADNVTRTRPPTTGGDDGGGQYTSQPPAGGGGPTISRAGAGAAPSGWLALAAPNETDPRLAGKSPAFPDWAGDMKLPSGHVGTILSGTKSFEGPEQQEILLPGFYGLYAVNKAPEDAMGTKVYDLGVDHRPDISARLQSLMSVEQVGSTDDNALAIQMGGTGQAGAAGYMMLSDWNTGVVATGSHYGGGPMLCGPDTDQHNVGTTRDGKPINAGHVSIKTLFHGQGWDCPIFFEGGPWPKPQIGPHKILVHLVNDISSSHAWGAPDDEVNAARQGAGLGRWYADAFFYSDEDDPPPEDPPPFPPPYEEVVLPPGGGGERPRTGDGVGLGGGNRKGTDGGIADGRPVTGSGVTYGENDAPAVGFNDATTDDTSAGDDSADDEDTGPQHPETIRLLEEERRRRDAEEEEGPQHPETIRLLEEERASRLGDDTPVVGQEPNGRHTYATSSNCILANSGVAFRAAAWSTGEQDYSGAGTVTDADRALMAQGSMVGSITGYGVGNGTWDGFTYADTGDGSDGQRRRGDGALMFLPSWVSAATVLQGGVVGGAQAGNPLTMTLPTGYTRLAFGTPDTTTGSVTSGTRVYQAEGGLAIEPLDAVGDAYGDAYFSLTTTGLEVHAGQLKAETLHITGKATIDGLIDPTGLVFSEQPSDPMSGAQVGLYAGDTAGANEPFWRRDDGTVIDLSDTAAGGGDHDVADAATNTSVEAVGIGHTTSGTAAIGFGVHMDFELEDDGGTAPTAGRLDVTWTNATAAGSHSELSLYHHVNNVLTKGLSLGGGDEWQLRLDWDVGLSFIQDYHHTAGDNRTEFTGWLKAAIVTPRWLFRLR